MDQRTTEDVGIVESVHTTLRPATRLEPMDTVVTSRTLRADRIRSTGAKAVALEGCEAHIQAQNPVRTQARLTDTDGRPLEANLVYRVEVLIFEVGGADRPIDSKTIDPGTVLFGAGLLEWEEDAIGYNFDHEVEGIDFRKGGSQYLLTYVLHMIGRVGAFTIDVLVTVRPRYRDTTW